jgi:adenine-specific DNA-methyltransferase
MALEEEGHSADQEADRLVDQTTHGSPPAARIEPDILIQTGDDGQLTLEVRGLDVYDPATGTWHKSSVTDIASWFVDTDFDGEHFVVRQAYFIGSDAGTLFGSLLRPGILGRNADAQTSVSRPFAPPNTGTLAVKVVGRAGVGEIVKVFRV